MPDSTLWQLEPHTAVKHSILRRYLQAFYPKVASWSGRIVFIDGFAGPGEYAGGEPGSPIIALDAAISHQYDMSQCEFVFLFIEQDHLRCAHLRSILDQRALPPNVKVEIREGTFEGRMQEALNALEGELAPSLVMVDPFGVKGLPLRLLERIARFRRSELLVSFMYEGIARFLTTAEFEPHLDDLFGHGRWREAQGMGPDAKRRFLVELYSAALRSIGMEYVRTFELRDRGNRSEYFLTFATHHIEGLKAMKDAMWRADRIGGSFFSDTTNPHQPTLFAPEPDFGQLRALIQARFAGSSATTTEIEEFVVKDTAFRETHYKKQILAVMEKSGEITVTRPMGKTRAFWGAGTAVRFT